MSKRHGKRAKFRHSDRKHQRDWGNDVKKSREYRRRRRELESEFDDDGRR